MDHIRVDVATAEDGARHAVGRAAVEFCEEDQGGFDLCVCGNRGLGAVRRCATWRRLPFMRNATTAAQGAAFGHAQSRRLVWGGGKS